MWQLNSQCRAPQTLALDPKKPNRPIRIKSMHVMKQGSLFDQLFSGIMFRILQPLPCHFWLTSAKCDMHKYAEMIYHSVYVSTGRKLLQRHTRSNCRSKVQAKHLSPRSEGWLGDAPSHLERKNKGQMTKMEKLLSTCDSWSEINTGETFARLSVIHQALDVCDSPVKTKEGFDVLLQCSASMSIRDPRWQLI